MKTNLWTPELKTRLKGSGVMAIDPGLSGTGVSVFKPGALVPYECFNMTTPKNLEWFQRVGLIYDKLRTEAEWLAVSDIVCEFPEFFASAGGEMVANRGDLLKLTCVAAQGMAVARELGIRWWPVPVRIWKGQLPKEKVVERLKKRFCNGKSLDLNRELVDELDRLPDHVWDSVGIGMFTRGDF